jgi:hypothetical protein
MNNDNFDALWSNLKEQVIAARKAGNDRHSITTDGTLPGIPGYGGSVTVWSGDEDGAVLYVTNHNGMIKVNCQPSDLRAIAAQCLAAADEIEDALKQAQAITT